MEVAESDAIVPGFAEDKLASMGPRLGSRGKRDVDQLGSQTKSRLQWGRDLEVAERRKACLYAARIDGFNGAATWKSRKGSYTDAFGTKLSSFNGAATWKSRKVGDPLGMAEPSLALQWGRDLEVAESSRLRNQRGYRCCFNGAATWKSRKGRQARRTFLELGTASMGPRLGSRGKRKGRKADDPDARASMGPRLGSRGKCAAMLPRPDQDSASMGPRLGSRGKMGRCLVSRVTIMLQWGRDLEVAESLQFCGD